MPIRHLLLSHSAGLTGNCLVLGGRECARAFELQHRKPLAHSHTRTKTGGEILLFLSFGFMSPITSFNACLSICACVCVFMCAHASARVCRQVRQQTLTVRFHAPQAVPQTDILRLGVEEVIGARLLQEAFTNVTISRSQL